MISVVGVGEAKNPESSCASSDTLVGMEVQASHMVFTGTTGRGRDPLPAVRSEGLFSPHGFLSHCPSRVGGASLYPGWGGDLHALWGLLTSVGLGPQCVRVWCSLQQSSFII